MEKSDCKGGWIGKGDGLAFCPIHNQHFWTKKQQVCKFYSDGTTPDKKVEPLKVEQGVEQGVGSLTRKSVLKVDDKHSHAFRFTLRFSDDLSNWSSRDRTLKSKGFKAVRKAGIGKVFMSDCYGFKCWFADKSITVYFPSWKRYFVDSARTGYNYAVGDLLDLVVKLEDVFGVSFKIDGTYRFKVGKQHHGLIHNDLAKMYNRKKDLLNVYDKDGELWLLIDNSNPEGFGLNEIECVSTQKAIKDMDEVIDPFFNQLRDTGLMPKDILEMIKELAINQAKQNNAQMRIINDVTSNQKVFADNQVSHVTAVQKLGNAVGKLDKRIGKLGELQSKSESRKDKTRKILKKWGW